MKKILFIGLIVGLALVLVGGAGVVYAQLQQNANPTVTATTNQNAQPYGPQSIQRGGIIINRGTGDDGIFVNPGGMMNGYGYGPGGMMGGYGYSPGGMMGGYGRVGQYMGVMREYMISAFAKAVGLTVDEVNTRLANGETPAQIAIAQGKTEADLPALWTQVHTDAVNAALAAGVITQAQADRMLQMMNNYTGPGFGPGYGFGNCPMWDNDNDFSQPNP